MGNSTIKDIERETGLSKATISKYLNGGNVRPANRIAIEAAIKKHNYHRNETASVIRRGSRNTVAIVIPSLDMTYCREILTTCQTLLLKANMTAGTFNYMLEQKNESIVIHKILDNFFDGIISISSNPHADCYARALDEGVPTLFITDKPSPQTLIPHTNNVIINTEKASDMLLAELHRCGHRRIGIIYSHIERSIMAHNTDAYFKMIKERFFDVSQENIYTSKEHPVSLGYNGVRRFMAMDDPPTAIICFTGEILLGAKMAILEMGLSIPEDISVIGVFDNVVRDNPGMKDISGLFYPAREAATEAVNIILKCIENKKCNNAEDYYTSEIVAQAHITGSIRPIAVFDTELF